MRAIVEEETLVWGEVPRPVPGEGEVRIQVRATAVNRADLVQRAGAYPPPPGASEILGLECSGTVEALGPGAPPELLGREVCALLAGGGYAEYVVCPASHTLPVPRGMDLREAAALPEVFATAYLNLREEGALEPGERVLVHAGASGVGTAAIQLCAAWGNPVFATVGSPEKEARCRHLGASGTADRHAGPWEDAVRAWGEVDVILDPVGGPYLAQGLRVLRRRGRIVLIGLMGGREGTLPLGRLLVQRLSLRGSVLRSRSREEKDEVVRGLLEEVWPLVEAGRVGPVVDRVLALPDAEEAHRIVSGNQTVGKILLEL